MQRLPFELDRFMADETDLSSIADERWRKKAGWRNYSKGPGEKFSVLVNLEQEHHMLYFLIREEEVVYVGRTKDIVARIRCHLRYSDKEFGAFACFPVVPTNLPAVEKYFIQLLQPQYNKLHTRRYHYHREGGVTKLKPTAEMEEAA